MENEIEIRYWMNSDMGRVIAAENRPGLLWDEIDFDTYYRTTHPGLGHAKIDEPILPPHVGPHFVT